MSQALVLAVASLAHVGCINTNAANSESAVPPKLQVGQEFPVTTGQLPREGFFDGVTLAASSIDKVASQVQAGGVLIVSEQHGNQKHYAHQKLALQALAKSGRCAVSVGLEFLAWNHQDAITKYFSGALSEADFLRSTEWGSNPWVDYKDQALFPKSTGGSLVGVNAVRSLTGAISKKGLANLAPEETALMPPNFELGTAAYRERFDIVMGGHVPPDAVDRYFAAQSTWDDTMAWQAAEFLKMNPSHCLAIIVGDFHAAWGGGLPQRLRARGVSSVTVISQVETRDLSEVELSAELGPHPNYGSRSDAIWLSLAPPDEPPTSPLRTLNFFQ
ncbi:hypothetical protein BH10BDE1_BH10BDE1_11070 [soil metagenome]